MSDAPAKSESTFARTQRVLGALVGGFSVFALVAKTWIDGVAAPLELVVDTYNALLNVALGWAQPYVHALAETLTRWTGFDLHLYPHWKESLVAYGVLVGAGGSALIEAKLPAVPRPLATALGAAAGVVVGLIDAMLNATSSRTISSTSSGSSSGRATCSSSSSRRARSSRSRATSYAAWSPG